MHPFAGEAFPPNGQLFVFDEEDVVVYSRRKPAGVLPTEILRASGLPEGTYDVVVMGNRPFKRTYVIEHIVPVVAPQVQVRPVFR